MHRARDSTDRRAGTPKPHAFSRSSRTNASHLARFEHRELRLTDPHSSGEFLASHRSASEHCLESDVYRHAQMNSSSSLRSDAARPSSCLRSAWPMNQSLTRTPQQNSRPPQQYREQSAHHVGRPWAFVEPLQGRSLSRLVSSLQSVPRCGSVVQACVDLPLVGGRSQRSFEWTTSTKLLG